MWTLGWLGVGLSLQYSSILYYSYSHPRSLIQSTNFHIDFTTMPQSVQMFNNLPSLDYPIWLSSRNIHTKSVQASEKSFIYSSNTLVLKSRVSLYLRLSASSDFRNFSCFFWIAFRLPLLALLLLKFLRFIFSQRQQMKCLYGAETMEVLLKNICSRALENSLQNLTRSLISALFYWLRRQQKTVYGAMMLALWMRQWLQRSFFLSYERGFSDILALRSELALTKSGKKSASLTSAYTSSRSFSSSLSLAFSSMISFQCRMMVSLMAFMLNCVSFSWRKLSSQGRFSSPTKLLGNFSSIFTAPTSQKNRSQLSRLAGASS